MSDAAKKAKPARPGLFCGASVDLKPRFRFLSFLALAILSFCLCFSQFGVMAYGDLFSNTFNFAFFIIPTALCTVMLGAVPGVSLAFLTALFIFFRAQWTYTSAYDFHLADP